MRATSISKGLGLILVLGSVGCMADAAEQTGKGRGSPLGASVDLPDAVRGNGPLTAYETDEERSAGAKQDALVSTRTFDQLYAPTTAPAAGVRPVAEWEHVDSVIVHWDAALDNFFMSMVDAIHRVANVHLITANQQESDAAKQRFTDLGMDVTKIHFFEYANDSIWARDFGPITIEKPDGTPAFVDLAYYGNRKHDDAMPTLMADYYGLDVYRPQIQAEGGNFMSNGNGVCVFSDVIPARNGLAEQAVVDVYKNYFGCQQVVVGQHLDNEGTGHIDMWTKFGQEGVVLVGQYDPNDDPANAAILDNNAAKLAAVTLPNGQKLKVVRIPMPAPRGSGRYQVFESFTNALVVNQTVLIPRYDDAKALEADALAAYKLAFPAGYQFKWIPSTDVIDWGGAVHCTTMAYSVGPIPALGSLPTPVTAESLFQINPVIAIEDNEEVDSTIEVPTSLTEITGVIALDMSIEHSYTGDLVIELEHAGVTDTIFEGRGEGTNINRTFDSEAFKGTPKSGAWTLKITDTARQDTGTLFGWRLGFAK